MKDTYIRIRLTSDDKAVLQSIAERDNTSMSAVITKIAMGQIRYISLLMVSLLK